MLSFLKFSVPHYCGFIHEIIIAFSFPLIQAQSVISAKVFKEQYQIFLLRNHTTLFLSVRKCMT